MQLVRQVPFRARRRHPTLAALAMMTGVATWVAVGLGAVVGPRVMKCFCESKSDVARATVARYVDEAYPSWQAAHPERLCPQRLSELDEFMTARHGLDVWGNPYHFACGPNMVPAGAGTFWVISAGEDGQFGTDDDIRSDR